LRKRALRNEDGYGSFQVLQQPANEISKSLFKSMCGSILGGCV
jgi:hypothetical protein